MVFTCMSIAAESVRRIIEMERERAAAAAVRVAVKSFLKLPGNAEIQ